MRYEYTPADGVRFWAKVAKDGPCWRWTASYGTTGYGQFGVGGRAGRPVQAHRVAWELTNGLIPHGLFVLHRCDNRACVNPDHLFLGTQADNMADMTAKGRNGYLTKPERIARGDRHAFMLHPERRPRGERNGSAKLTETTVRDIRALIATGGIGPVEIARRFGIHRTTVHRIVNRKIWRDLA